jgi:hypothetical protein
MINTSSTAYRKYLKGELNSPLSDAGYKKWRDMFPWSNEEIVACLRKTADDLMAKPTATAQDQFMADALLRKNADALENSGRLSGRCVRLILNILITKCGVCGGKALYRKGTEGRCKQHRDVPASFEAEQEQRRRDKAQDFLKWRAQRDTADIARTQCKQTTKGKKRGYK